MRTAFDKNPIVKETTQHHLFPAEKHGKGEISQKRKECAMFF